MREEKNKLNQESVAHFVTVIGALMQDANEIQYQRAIQYALEFIKYRFDEDNIK